MNNWKKWAVLEGAARALGRILAKLLGTEGRTLGAAFVVTLVNGVVQFTGGFAGGKIRQETIFQSPAGTIYGILFGLVATAMTTLSVLTFTYPGADVGVAAFIFTLSIIPGAFIDWIFFGHALQGRQFIGMILFLLAGWLILDFPDLKELLALPAWVWIMLSVAFLAAVNEAISQASRRLDPLVNNFWVGLSTIIFCVLGITLLGSWGLFRELSLKFWLGALATGILAFSLISFKLLSYKAGGTIAPKKIVMQGTSLALAIILGVMIWSEPFTLGKVLGVAGFFLAHSLMESPRPTSVEG